MLQHCVSRWNVYKLQIKEFTKITSKMNAGISTLKVDNSHIQLWPPQPFKRFALSTATETVSETTVWVGHEVDIFLKELTIRMRGAANPQTTSYRQRPTLQNRPKHVPVAPLHNRKAVLRQLLPTSPSPATIRMARCMGPKFQTRIFIHKQMVVLRSALITQPFEWRHSKHAF